MKLLVIPLTSFVVVMSVPHHDHHADAYVHGTGLPNAANRFTTANQACPLGTTDCMGDPFTWSSTTSSWSSEADSNRSERHRQRRERVNQAFAELQRELGDNARAQRKRGGGRGRYGKWAGGGGPSFFYNGDIDREAVKKWVDRAFDLASEWNRDFAPTPEDRGSNEEILDKSREWVEKLYNEGDPSGAEGVVGTAAAEDDVNDDKEVAQAGGGGGMDVGTESTPPPSKEPRAETPYSENRSTDERFQVAVDLPGVERPDIDLALEGDFLTIEAIRQPRGDGQAGRKYVKKFALVDGEVDVNEIEATLENGVLIVTAPKKKKEETKKKIPVS